MENLSPDKAFPAEVLALQKRGVPLPTWFAGPVYLGNGPGPGLKLLEEEHKRVASQGTANTDDENVVF